VGTFAVERTVAASPLQVWNVLTDWSGYARWMPLTTMRLDKGRTRVGWSFAGLTGIGRLRFADVMLITKWEPPAGSGRGAFRLVKVGRLLAGWADVSVLPMGHGEQTRLVWRENMVIRPRMLGRMLAPLTDRLNQALFARVIDDMAAEAVRGSARPASGQH
jgi:carbon monoxide dehydrogenase subunit G